MGLAAGGRDATGSVELSGGRLELTILEQGNSEVVGGEADQLVRILELVEDLDGIRWTMELHQDVRAEILGIIADGFRNRTFHSVEDGQGILGLILLEVQSGQSERGVCAHGLVDFAFEDSLHCTSCTQVHAIVELEITDREFRMVEMRIERIEAGLIDVMMLCKLGVEPLEGAKVVALIRVIERLAEVRIF